MSWGSEDTCAASLLCECMCASSKILLWQNSSHSAYSGKDARLSGNLKKIKNEEHLSTNLRKHSEVSVRQTTSGPVLTFHLTVK